MRLIEQHPGRVALEVTEENLNRLKAWISQEVEDALSSRSAQEAVWREDLTAYEGVPRNPIVNYPVQNAPNIVITLGAIAVDSIYSQALDLAFTVSPPVTARSTHARSVDAVGDLQDFIDWGVRNEWNLRGAAEHTILDDVQLGSGMFYIPWVEHRKKTKTHTTTTRGPCILPIPIEDFIVPGGATGDLQSQRWCGLRFWYTQGELHDRARAEKWKYSIEHALPTGSIGWMRTRREMLGRTSSGTRVATLYEVYRLWIYFDIDGDGYDEDIQVIWDRTSRSVFDVRFNPYDRRPAEGMRYQLRAHLWYGLGVMTMARPFQDETTAVHNQRVLNMLLANARIWKGRTGAIPDNMTIWPGKVIELANPDDLQPEAMAEVYPSSLVAETVTISLAERRLGVNDLSTPRPSAVLGSRTPGITALSMLQQISKRFTGAFDNIRHGCAAAVRQCLYRYQERLLAGDQQAEDHIVEVLGPEKGLRVIELLKHPRFDESVVVELTASSASVNRDADRQNAIMLVNLLGTYYQRVLELMAIAASPQTPPQVRDVAQKIAGAAGKIIERTIRTFDVIRDPDSFVIDVNAEIDQIQDMSQQGMQGLQQLMSTLGQGLGGAMQGDATQASAALGMPAPDLTGGNGSAPVG